MNFKLRNCNCNYRLDREEKPTLKELQAEIETLKKDSYNIKYMQLSDNAKKICISELTIKIRELKNKMHDLIEEM